MHGCHNQVNQTYKQIDQMDRIYFESYANTIKKTVLTQIPQPNEDCNYELLSSYELLENINLQNKAK